MWFKPKILKLCAILIVFLIVFYSLYTPNTIKIRPASLKNIRNKKLNDSIRPKHNYAQFKADNGSLGDKFGVPNVYTPRNESEDYMTGYLQYSGGSMPIFVHGSYDLISKDILVKHSWEKNLVDAMEMWLSNTPDLNLIDIGCNLGVYSLVAGKRGRRVIAVDANIDNIRRLSKSIFTNRIENAIILHNAVSDHYSYFHVYSPSKSNIGHSMLRKQANSSSTKVKSIIMNDLLKVIDFRKAIMKIDIEGHEFEAFKHADRLFSSIDIVAVLIEWNWLKIHSDANVPQSIIRFFITRQYLPYATLNNKDSLKVNDYKAWPWDIVWKKSVRS